jgi:hypothetical protein
MDSSVSMVNWKVIEDGATWTELLKKFGESQHYMQAWSWGEHRSHFGWQPFRCVAHGEDGREIALVQFLVRRLPGRIGIVWVPGGPIGKAEAWAESLLGAVKAISGLRQVVVKMNLLRPYHAGEVLTLRAFCWIRTASPLTSGLSMVWDISSDSAARVALATRNWRHNLKRSGKYGLNVERWESPDAQEISVLYGEMEQLKGLSEQVTQQAIESMLRTMGESLLIYRCLDVNGRMISLRACAILDNQAWDLMAAAGNDARKVYASYATLWGMAEECHARGVKLFDLAGVDPQKNKGVWDFKRGTGAQPMEYLGEWECATSEIYRKGINFIIRLRGVGE